MDERGRPETLVEAAEMLRKAARNLADAFMRDLQEVWEKARRG